uniref:CD80-like immunoglobulin C2-set domain-containing protein n=1 Tax=Timema cristinae TaxID=61476 RepID=A0A7R9GZ15_TIMCR|nr:unnamed protein product [Timema cristinae]
MVGCSRAKRLSASSSVLLRPCSGDKLFFSDVTWNFNRPPSDISLLALLSSRASILYMIYIYIYLILVGEPTPPTVNLILLAALDSAGETPSSLGYPGHITQDSPSFILHIIIGNLYSLTLGMGLPDNALHWGYLIRRGLMAGLVFLTLGEEEVLLYMIHRGLLAGLVCLTLGEEEVLLYLIHQGILAGLVCLTLGEEEVLLYMIHRGLLTGSTSRSSNHSAGTGELLDSLRGPQVSTPFHPYLPPADGSLTTPVTTPNHPYNFQPLPTRPKSDEGPRISGGRPRYQVGDMVRVNCTSGRSKPAAQLVWFINGQQADSSFLRGPDIVQNGREDLETSVLGLEFRVMPKHFKRGDMKLKCLATIATVYWRSNEESVEGDRPQRTPVLESRETVPPSQSRADRVQVLCKVLADSLGPVMWKPELANRLFKQLLNCRHEPELGEEN